MRKFRARGGGKKREKGVVRERRGKKMEKNKLRKQKKKKEQRDNLWKGVKEFDSAHYFKVEDEIICKIKLYLQLFVYSY